MMAMRSKQKFSKCVKKTYHIPLSFQQQQKKQFFLLKFSKVLVKKWETIFSLQSTMLGKEDNR